MRTDCWAGKHTVWLLGLGYMFFYIPYSGLTKALTSGVLMDTTAPISGFQMLPATALGAMLGMPIFLFATGLWRHARRYRLPGGGWIPGPGRWTALSALATAVIIGSTTLNYTFAGVSIVFVLLLMRGGVLILSPLVDLYRRRPVNGFSWTALVLSLLAVTISLADVNSYQLTLLAVFSLAAYLAGYMVRFLVMSKHAKSGHAARDRQFFVEEHMSATPALVLLLGAMAVFIPGQPGAELRYGFGAFLTQPAAIPAFLIGILYESLFIFGSLIYLHPREYTYCVPINRASSLLAGVIAAYLLAWLYDLSPPQTSTLVGLGFMLTAMALLAVGPRLAWLLILIGRNRIETQRCLYVFVCNQNTARSPMAEALCLAEIERRTGLRVQDLEAKGIKVVSAGLNCTREPMRLEAAAALRQMGVEARDHVSRPLTAALISEADAIYCMTEQQRRVVRSLAPEHSDRIHTLRPWGDIPNPKTGACHDYLECARQLKSALKLRIPQWGFD